MRNPNTFELSRRNFVKLFGGVSVAAALGLAGCGGSGGGTGSGESGEAVKGGTLNVGFNANPVGPTNIWVGNDLNSAMIMNLVVPCLVTMDPEGNKTNYLVEETTSNDDATVWTVKLKELYWNDGEPLTADDLVFTATYGVEKAIGFFPSYYGSVAEAVAIDDRTVEFTMSETAVNFFNAPGYWIPVMRKSEWEGVEDPLSYSDYSGAGYGPYYIDEWVDGQYVHLKRNEYFTAANDGEGAWIDEVMFRIYTDENAMVLALENGEVDVCGNFITANSKTQVEGNESYQVEDVSSLGYGQLSFSQTHPALQNTNVRIALSMLIDREAVCSVGLSGGGIPMPCPISPVYEKFVESDIQQPGYDVEAAKELLESEGYTEGADGIRVNADGTRLSFKLTYKGTGQFDNVIEVLRSAAAEAGVEYDPEALDNTAYSAKVNGHEFDIAFSSWGTIDDVDTSLHNVYGIGETLNFMDYENQEMDDLLLQMRQTIDEDERIKLLDEWQQLWVDNMPAVNIYVPVQTYVASTANYTGFEANYGNNGYMDCSKLTEVHQVQ